MPLDPRIIAGAGQGVTPLRDPLETMGAVYQLQGAQQVQQVRQLQLEEAQRQEFERQNLGQAIRGTLRTDPVTGQRRPDLMAGLAQAYTTSRDPLALFKVEQDYTKSQAESRKTALEAYKVKIEGLQKQSEYISGLANGVLAAVDQGADPQATYQRAVQEATAVLGPEMIQGLPPTFDRGVVTQFAMKGLTSSQALQAQQKAVDQQIAALDLQERQKRTGIEERRVGLEERRVGVQEAQERREAGKPVAAPGQAVQDALLARYGPRSPAQGYTTAEYAAAQQDAIDAAVQKARETGTAQIVQTPQGYARVNPRTGAVEMVEGPQGTLQPKPTTEENRAASFADRAQQAHDTALQLEQKGITPNVLTQGAQKLPLGLGNYLLPAEHQQYQQSILQFTQNLLRKESGAAISQSEYDMTNKTYFPQPGDSAEVIQQKQAARAKVLEELRREGARATPQGGTPGAGTGGAARSPHAAVPIEQMTPQQVEAEERWLLEQLRK